MTEKTKRHQVLDAIAASLNNNLPTTTVRVLGHEYTLTVLKPEAEDWAAIRSVGGSAVAYSTTTMKPRLAAAITAIDGVPVEQLFELPSSMELNDREAIAASSRALRDWRREQLLDFLKESGDGVLVEDLFKAFADLTVKHRKDLREGVPDFSERTPSGV